MTVKLLNARPKITLVFFISVAENSERGTRMSDVNKEVTGSVGHHQFAELCT